MTSQTEKAKAKLANLSSSFDDLEAILEPLFAQTLPESIMTLEPIQQAKLQTVLPYLVYDLIFIYLKSRGIDPKTHPVVSELDRVKQYFEKISVAENPPTKRAEIDKGAAQRFIKHAITQATYMKATTEDTPAATSSVRVQTKITSKMLERQLYEQKLKEQDAQESEDEGLQVFEDNDESMEAEPSAPKINNNKGKAKANEVPSTPAGPTSAGAKRRRPTLDPFAGYGDDDMTPTTADASRAGTPAGLSNPGPKARKSKKQALDTSVDSPAGEDDSQNSPAPRSTDVSKSKKTKKKARKSLT